MIDWFQFVGTRLPGLWLVCYRRQVLAQYRVNLNPAGELVVTLVREGSYGRAAAVAPLGLSTTQQVQRFEGSTEAKEGLTDKPGIHNVRHSGGLRLVPAA